MALDLTALREQVARDQEVNTSAATLISGLAAKLEEMKGDPAAIQELADQLRANSDALSTAVAENTPAEG